MGPFVARLFYGKIRFQSFLYQMLTEWKPELRDVERTTSVRTHLFEVLSSDAFKGGKRAQDFLQLVVEHALAGRTDNLRERMLGAEMFGRPVGYDTANDAVVRVKASEVRKRLAQYYQTLAAPPAIRIDLQSGSYVPQFYIELPETSESTPPSASEVVLPEIGPPPPVQPVHASGTRPSRTRQAIRKFTPRRWGLATVGLGLLAFVGYFAVQQEKRSSSAKQIRSIAILPLQNFSGDPDQEYFADGMTEELTTELGQIASLRVISRTSTMTYKGTKKTLPEIAGELHVDAIVEGSIEREGNMVRITTQLIDSKTDQHIWAHSYDRDITSVLELQSEVARDIADQIRIQLTPAVQARFNRTQRVDPKAVELYLRGRQRENIADPKAARDYFEQAVQKDPNYAAAHTALANVYGWMGSGGWMPYAEAFSRERAEALKAIELDDSSPEPHLALSSAAMDQSWDWVTQKQELQRALDLNPNSAEVVEAYAGYLMHQGRTDEAVAETKLSLQLDPVSSRSFLGATFICYFARKYDLALEYMQKASALDHKPDEGLFPLGVIYIEEGRYDEGIQELEKIGDQPHALGHMGNAYARAGRIAEARALLPKLMDHIQKTGIGRYEIALVYAGLKDNNNAFDWLEKAYQARDKGLTYLKVDPCLDPLRSDPRFANLEKRVGLPV
jgi:TolB-like protein/Tfp pilus assembly protein PilF